MYSKLLAETLKRQNVRVACVDPGWVQTDMGGANASRTPKEVAEETYNLFMTDFPTGKFWKNNAILAW